MDVMQLRRSLMMQMLGGGNMAKGKSGTFTGDGTATVDLNIGFKPDVVIIESDVDYTEAGWSGIGHGIIAKNLLTQIYRHTNDSAITVSATGKHLMDTDLDYGDATWAGSYVAYGIYNNGVFTWTNKNPNTQGCKFVSGVSYRWKALAK